jgi:methionyl-tRNA synthetase
MPDPQRPAPDPQRPAPAAEPSARDKAFYITTPIYYVTAAPSIGSAYTTVAADVIARWHRQRQEHTWFLTGTDEHGQKVLEARRRNTLAAGMDGPARRAGVEAGPRRPRRHQRRLRPHHRGTPHHACPGLLVEAARRWEVYQGTYEGPYCIACEEFKLPGELLDGPDGQQLCPIHHRPVESLSEANWFFPLSHYADRLLELYETQPSFVQPESARNEVMSFVRQGLSDLSISRSTFDWGIRVPWDPDHVFYVWIDALLNYATAVGYGGDEAEFAQRWPPTSTWSARTSSASMR